MRGILLLLFLCMFLGANAQDIHHVYGWDDTNYFKRKKHIVEWADTFEMMGVKAFKGINYKQKRKFNGLCYFYDTLGSKYPGQAIYYKRNKSEFRKNFPNGQKEYVLYYKATYQYHKNGKVKQVGIVDSSYTSFSGDQPPAVIKYYDTSGNLQAEEKQSLIYEAGELINKWQTIVYFKNGVPSVNRVVLWMQDEHEYWRKLCRKTITEYFDSITGCKTKEVSYLSVRPCPVHDFFYTEYWDTVYKIFRNCSTIPDTSLKIIHTNSVFSAKHAEYKGDTLYKYTVKWHTPYSDSLSRQYGEYEEYYTNGNLKYMKSIVGWEPDTVEVMFDSSANLLFIRSMEPTGKEKQKENLYYFDEYKDYLSISAVSNGAKRVERYYHPNGNLYMKCVYRKGKLRREKQY